MNVAIVLLLVAAAAVANANVVAVQAQPGKPVTSADTEDLYNPTVHVLPDGEHKLVYQDKGVEQCLVCQPHADGCGCGDIIGVRCDMKRLKQKLLRLKNIAAQLYAHPQH